MGVHSGFFSSKDGDRLYSASDLNGFLDGLVGEGVFKNYKRGLLVTSFDYYKIKVSEGKAWFRRTYTMVDEFGYTLNSAFLLPPSITSFYVAIEVNEDVEFRTGKIILTTTLNERHLPLAKIIRNNQAEIIEVIDLRGTSQCPWVVGLLANFTANEIVDQMDNPTFEEVVDERVDLKMDPLYDMNRERFNNLYTTEETKMDALHDENRERFNNLYTNEKTKMDILHDENETRFNTLYTNEETKMDTLHDENETRFDTLYESLSSSAQDIVNEVLKKMPTVPLELDITDDAGNNITASIDGTTETDLDGLIYAVVRTGDDG